MTKSDPKYTPLHEWVTQDDLDTKPSWHLGPPSLPSSMMTTPDDRWMHSVLEDMDEPAAFEVGGLHGSDLLKARDREQMTHWYLLLIDRCWGAWGEANDPRWAAITVDQTGKAEWADEGANLLFLQMLVTVGEFLVTLDAAMVRDQQILDASRRLVADLRMEMGLA